MEPPFVPDLVVWSRPVLPVDGEVWSPVSLDRAGPAVPRLLPEALRGELPVGAVPAAALGAALAVSSIDSSRVEP